MLDVSKLRYKADANDFVNTCKRTGPVSLPLQSGEFRQQAKLRLPVLRSSFLQKQLRPRQLNPSGCF